MRFSTLEADVWSSPRIVAQGDDWFVNWADVPSLISLEDGTLVAHWLRKSGEAKYAYEIRLSFSHDRGQSWSEPQLLHDDGTPTEHGFVSLLPWHHDQVMAIWLDGRKMAAAEATVHEHAAMTVRWATLDREGRALDNGELDERACDCCPTAAVRTGADAALVAYRDRDAQEIRDIALARFAQRSWQASQVVHADGWEVPGCPVNGPSLDEADGQVVLTWFTAAHDQPRVLTAHSLDGGQTFGPPLRVDEGDPVGRATGRWIAPGRTWILWLEQGPEDASLRVRERRGQELLASWPLTSTSGQRASGIPRMVTTPGGVVFAWTDPEASQVKTARVVP